MSILNIEDLSIKYKKHEVLNNINLRIEEGEIVALIGPNGSGKTTLMKAICNLININAGEIKINNYSSQSRDIKYLSQFSCIIESPTFYEDLSGYENLKFIADLNNRPKESIDEIIEFINIGPKINRCVKEYSLGMKQRLALGIVIIQNPKLIILDEPTNGLDMDAVIQFRTLILKLKLEKKISVLIATHNISDIESLTDRVFFIKNKKIHNVTSYKNNSRYKKLILFTNNIEALVGKLKSCKEVESFHDLDKGRVKVIVRKENVVYLLGMLVAEGGVFQDIEVYNKGLEEIYEEFYNSEELERELDECTY